VVAKVHILNNFFAGIIIKIVIRLLMGIIRRMLIRRVEYDETGFMIPPKKY
jgi:hypothetical protein